MSKYNTMGVLFGVLMEAGRPISTKQVSNFSGMAWKTSRDNLEKLFNLGLVLKGQVKNNKRIYWKNA